MGGLSSSSFSRVWAWGRKWLPSPSHQRTSAKGNRVLAIAHIHAHSRALAWEVESEARARPGVDSAQPVLEGEGDSPGHDLTVASLSYFTALVVEVTGHAHVLLAAFEKVSAVLVTPPCNLGTGADSGEAECSGRASPAGLSRTCQHRLGCLQGAPCHRLTFPPPATILFHQVQHPQVPPGPGHSLAWNTCAYFTMTCSFLPSCWLQLVVQ